MSRDLWARLPGWVRVSIAVGTIFAAGGTATVVAHEYQGMPSILDSHETRIQALERAREESVDRTNRNFVYLACRLDELSAGTNSPRCNLILDDETRTLLRQLRGP